MNEEYSYPFFDENGKIICQVCGKSYLVISPRHLGTHDIKYPEYKLRFPDAPLSCEEFKASGKFGKEKTIFVKEELEKIEQEEVNVVELDFNDVDDVPEQDVDETLNEKIDFSSTVPSESKQVDICGDSKNIILEHLKTFFTNIRKDYMIQEFSLNNQMLCEFITDFADPVLKIDIEFPNTFWHNKMQFEDRMRDQKLKDCGWKIIKINSRAPTYKQISEKLKGL